MIPCPTIEQLRSILSLGAGESPPEGLVEHLNSCEVCQRALVSLSSDTDHAVDNEFTSIMRSERSVWPGDVKRLDLDETDAIPSSTQDRETPLERTLTYVGDGSESEASEEPRTPVRFEFADYQVLKKLGAGGMGVVYLARQQSANRLVALKIIRPEKLDQLSPERRKTWLMRFRSEAQAAARLEHDNVVRVYEVGEFQRILYYSMQYIEGETLSHIIRRDPVENRRLARLMYAVAMAVDHAHHLGILHRDIKPLNILIQHFQPGSSSGITTDPSVKDSGSIGDAHERPYVTDFGLAKNYLDEDDEGATQTGEAIGSPSYMPPEQARDASRCTPASDVYSLGATLYDALTGRPPFRAATSLETLRQVMDEQPVSPRELNPAIDLDLQTITLKALEKDPARRYASARCLADDLQRYVKGEPIEARPISRPERLIRWCKRNPMVAALTGGIAALLLMVAVGSAVASERLRRYANLETLARNEAEQHFFMSLDVIDEMLTEFGDKSLEHVPQMELVRKELLQKALARMSDLLTLSPTSPRLRREYARTYYRIGNVYHLLGEHQLAQTSYAASISMLDELLRESPQDDPLRFSWATSHLRLGETLRMASQPGSRVHLELAIRSLDELHRLEPGRGDYTAALSLALNNLGLLGSESGDFPEAERRLNEAIEHLHELTQTPAGSDDDLAEAFADLGRSQINLGVLLRRIAGRTQESEKPFRDAIRNLERAHELDPENRDYRFRKAIATLDLANLLSKEGAGSYAQAVELAADATNELSQLNQEFPDVPKYHYEHANACNTAAVVLARDGKTAQALERFRNADDALETLSRVAPAMAGLDPRVASLRGRVLGGIGFLRGTAGELNEAVRLVERAIEQQQTAAQLQPDNPDYASYLQEHRDYLTQIQAQLAASGEGQPTDGRQDAATEP